MMSILKDIKDESLRLRKQKSALASYSTFIIGLCEAVGKSKGNRLSTDDEVQSVVNKQIKMNKDSLSISNNQDWTSQLRTELDFLNLFKPDFVDVDVLKKFIADKCIDMHIGQAMGIVKAEYGMSVDMGIASTLVKELNAAS